MKYLVAFLSILPLAVYAKVVAYIEHDSSKERIEFHDEKLNCPDETLYATYFDPRDGEKAEGCYIVRDGNYLVIFRTGTYSKEPLIIPKRMVKTYI